MLKVTAGVELVSTKNEPSTDVMPGINEANKIMNQRKKEAKHNWYQSLAV